MNIMLSITAGFIGSKRRRDSRQIIPIKWRICPQVQGGTTADSLCGTRSAPSGPHETDYILDRVHRFTRHFLRAGGPIRQHRVDRRRIGKKPFW
jgi:hypothetical protein